MKTRQIACNILSALPAWSLIWRIFCNPFIRILSFKQPTAVINDSDETHKALFLSQSTSQKSQCNREKPGTSCGDLESRNETEKPNAIRVMMCGSVEWMDLVRHHRETNERFKDFVGFDPRKRRSGTKTGKRRPYWWKLVEKVFPKIMTMREIPLNIGKMNRLFVCMYVRVKLRAALWPSQFDYVKAKR